MFKATGYFPVRHVEGKLVMISIPLNASNNHINMVFIYLQRQVAHTHQGSKMEKNGKSFSPHLVHKLSMRPGSDQPLKVNALPFVITFPMA